MSEVRMRRRIAVGLLMLVLAGCASAGGKERSASPTKNRNRNVITLEEIESSHESDTYLLVKSLRPNMLTTRGATSIILTDPGVIVFLDNQRFGPAQSLSMLPPADIAEIRFLSAAEAQSRWGEGFPQGVILVTSKRGR
jgi:type IV pilus biogenesis protein CpaD/CtpE